MYELYPYFTNDGTVGLFSREDDDIYHSTYGALSESWQKFILPSHLEEYIETHSDVKILDICYGIGYNSKTALNVFVKNVLRRKKVKKKNFFTRIFSKNSTQSIPTDAAIYTDNILEGNGEILKEKRYKNDINLTQDTNSIVAIHADNISMNEFDESDLEFVCNHILIDAVDVDKILMGLSPFIKIEPETNLFRKNPEENFYFQNKFAPIEKIKNSKYFPQNKIKKEFKLKREVPIIILIKLLENGFNIFDDRIVQTILAHKKYQPFLSRFIINFAKFCLNQGCNYNKINNKTAFLHNIYYRYLSRSYKNMQKLLKNNQIAFNFHTNDARRFIITTPNRYNFIFLDAFTPAKCPALWTVEFFRELYLRLEDDGMILTYSNSAAIRNAFLKNGFYVGKIYDTEFKKFTGTIAVKNLNLIEHELDERDLSLINSKAGICFKDEFLDLDERLIIENRKNEIEQSDLVSSSQILKGYNAEHL